MKCAFFRARAVAIVACIAVVAACPAGPVRAEIAPTDRVGDTTIADAPAGVRDASPDMDLPAGMLVTSGGEVLWARGEDERRAMASITKIMTCLVVLDETSPREDVTVSSTAVGVGGSGIYLAPGEVLSAGDLTLAMMLESSNAAACALAEHVAGSVPEFVEMMDERAEDLGLDDTDFSNPHGLDEEGHYTTVADLARLTSHAMSDAEFREIVGTEEATIGEGSAVRTLENSNVLLDTLEGATGVKTGWTTPAGYCVVASAERGDISLIAVIMGTRNETARFVEAERLLEWGFTHYRTRELTSDEETVAAVSVEDYLDRTVIARVASDTAAPVFDLEGGIYREYEVVAGVDAPVEEGDVLGSVTVLQGDETIVRVPLVADGAVPAPTLWERIGIFFTRAWRAVAGRPAT